MDDSLKHRKGLKSSSHPDEHSFSIIDFITIVARQIKIIIITPIIFCVVVIIYVLFIADPIYTSSSKIMSSSANNGGVTQAAGLAAQFGIALPSRETETKWAYPEIIKSRTLARSMLKRKFDTSQFGKQKSLFEILINGNSNLEFDRGPRESLAVDIFLQMINVSENIKTGILTLNVNALDPMLAAQVNQALIEELDTHQQNYNKAMTIDTKHFIEGRIGDTEKELMSAEENLKIFMDRNRRIENSPALQLEQQRLTREVTVLTGVFTTLKQQLETTKIEELKESEYVVVIDPPEVPISRSSPNRKALVILAGFTGILMGVFIGFFKEYFENSNGEDQKKLLKANVLLWENIYQMFPGKIKK